MMAIQEHGQAMKRPIVIALANWLDHRRACIVCKCVPRTRHAYCYEGNVLHERVRDEEARR